MTPLPLTFKSNGFEFTQVCRDGQLAIYSKRQPDWAKDALIYEVVRIKRNETYAIHGHAIEAHESYPKSEAWGKDGFAATTLQAAKAVFASMNQ